MPPKRNHLQSPNPVKYQSLELDDQSLEADTSGAQPRVALQDVTASINVIDETAAVVTIEAPPSSPALVALEVLPLTPPRSAAGGNAVVSPLSPALVALPFLPLTPPRSAAGGNAVVSPLSPSTNRSRFLHGSQPVRICCNLDLLKTSAGAKIAISAICIAVFPASANPDRRYIQICDQYGSTGLTVWNSNVSLFGTASVGKLVTCKRLVVQSHNGKRCLTMARDSTIEIEDDAQHSVVDWWKGLLRSRILNALEAHDAAENDIISLSGVVGTVTEESKIVGGRPRVLTTIHLVDATGKFLVRTWNHITSQFQSLVDQPISIQRVRVTAFAGEKLAELLDGNGSVITTDFPGCDKLRDWWNSA